MKITLPIPDAKLSPNARVHWAQLAKVKSAHRLIARCIASDLANGEKLKRYRLHFFWPDRRRRDRDNASAMCKSYLDGVADAFRQDDSEWLFDGVRFEIDKNNPRVEVRFDAALIQKI